MSADNVAAMRAMYQAMSTGDLDALDKVCHPDFVDHDAEPGQGPGLEGVKESFAGFRTAIPNMTAEVHDLFSAGDKVVARVTLTGTHTGNLGEIPASNNQISIPNIDIVRFEEGLAVERWGRHDSLAFLQQLGVIPPLG